MTHAWFTPLALALCLVPLASEAEDAPEPLRPAGPAKREKQAIYPWNLNITFGFFSVGDQRKASCWDSEWQEHFGGVDATDPTERIADYKTGDFRPKAFVPKLNPFYVALPCNDLAGPELHKPEAAKFIPWFEKSKPEPGKSVLKGQWIQIFNGKYSCYAQWEDAGPGTADDWGYVFGNQRPNASPDAASISFSPAIRDYLKLQAGEKCHWRFVSESSVPFGPWKKGGVKPTVSKNAAANKAYTDYLQKLREEEAAKEKSGTPAPKK